MKHNENNKERMRTLTDILHKLQIRELNIEEAHKEICSLFSVSGSLVSDKDIETEANNRYNPKWGGLNGMTEHKKFIEGAKWVKDNYR